MSVLRNIGAGLCIKDIDRGTRKYIQMVMSISYNSFSLVNTCTLILLRILFINMIVNHPVAP